MSKKFKYFEKYKRFFAYIKNISTKLFVLLETRSQESIKKDNNTSHKKYLKKLYPKKCLVDICLILLFLILFLSQIIITKRLDITELSCDNYIVMTIKGTGEQPILNSENTNIPKPDKIIINEGETYKREINENIQYTVQDLTLEQNKIKLIWNNDATSICTSCNDMFKGLTNIIDIDLTHFIFSNIVYMQSFFEGCSSLISINLSGANAENVKNMIYTFKGCTSLVTINFLNFKTNKIEGLIETFRDCGNITSLDLSSFDTPNLLTVTNLFHLCISLKYINFENFNTSKVTHMNGMFSNCKALESLNLSSFNTESVINLDQMFDQCNSLISLDLSSFYTHNLITMYAMFYNCNQMKYLDISNFNTTLVTNMGQIFDQCHSIKSLNLSHFNTQSATNMWHLFWNCYKLEFLDISNFDTHLITNMEHLFLNCASLKSLDLRSFNTSLVERMNSMFHGCTNLEIIDLNSFDTGSVKFMNNMFTHCNSLKFLNISHFYTPNLETMKEMFVECKLIESLDMSNFITSKITDMSNIFNGCESLKSINQNFDTSSVINMEKMFLRCKNIEMLNLSNFHTESVINIGYMFEDCQSLISLDISSFNTSKIKKMNNLFSNCKKLNSLNLSHFNTLMVEDMSSMFYGCNKLEYLDLSSFYTPSLLNLNKVFTYCESLKWINISNFNTSKVIDMSGLFSNCKALTSIDLQNFETSSTSKMHYMFDNCQSLTSVNISHFDTSKVSHLGHMFDQCRSLRSLDLSNFDTTLVTNIDNMFYNCGILEFLDISNFNTEKITNMETLFIDCRNLKSLNLSSFTIYDNTNINRIFANDNSNLILCYNESKMPSHFLNEANRFENSCRKLCIMNSKKFILDKEMCVDNCYNEDIYKYEYQDICYSECPIRTQLSNDSTYLCVDCRNYYNYEYTECIDIIPEGYYNNDTSEKTIDKCPIKCKICSLESLNKNLCILCNNNYYPKLNDSLNKNEFNECYNKDEEQIGYYLDNIENIFKPCYYKCKKCNIGGNDENNNCIECKDDTDYLLENGNCNIKITQTSVVLEDSTVNTYSRESESNSLYIFNSSDINEFTKSDNISNLKYQFDSSNIIEDSTINMNTNSESESNYVNSLGISIIKNPMEEALETTSSMQNINTISYSNNIYSDKIINSEKKIEYKYLYDINSISEETKKNSNRTYINIEQETIAFLKSKFSLKDEDKIYVSISETTKNDPHTATTDYIYEYILENGTKLNLSCIEEDIYIDVYVPIKDLELAKFDLTKKFAEQGYDIYDINSDFYNDFCSPANLGDNDITLKDRKKEIYPNNITLCKNNCKYNGVNIEEQRVICSCNNNSDKNINNDEFPEEDNGNFATYILDKINYKIFQCYLLFFDVKNLKKSYPFYIILIIFLIIQFLDIIYLCHTLRRLKIYMAREMPLINIKKIKNIEDIKTENDKLNTNKIENPPKKKNNKKSKSSKNVRHRKTSKSTKYIKSFRKSEKNLLNTELNIDIKNQNFDNNKYEKNEFNQKEENNIGNVDNFLKNKNKEEKETKDNINDLPYGKAIKVDKRNIFQIFYSFIIEKIELISIIISNNQIKIIIVVEYILALLINFFFNALLYSDDVVSNKYHNNGELDMIVTLTLSILSNLVTSIFCYYITYSRGIEDRLNLILEIRHKIHFYRNLKKFLLYLKIKFIFFYISQFVIFSASIYYIVIFCILYSCSQKSLVINYCYSLVESIITSFSVTLIILITRKIGLSCSNKYLYNISKFVNNKF